VPPSSLIMKVQLMSLADCGSTPSSARAIGGGAIQLCARDNASSRSSDRERSWLDFGAS
jgi:hypothetical protein